MKGSKISIQVTISASKQKTWDCYTQPEHIIHWNFASDDWQCPKAANNLRVGGKYFARMEAKDGSFGFDFEAVYTSMALGKSFTYILADEREVNVKLIENSGLTEIHITFDAETENAEELQRNGWQAILNNFKKYVEGV